MARGERRARKPTLSPTKITTYLACSLKYRWTYVDPRGKWYLRSKHYYSFGSMLHKVLERFHDSGDQGVQTASDAVTAVEKEWVSAGFETKEQELQALAAGKEIVERYVAASIAAPAEFTTLFLEKMLRADMGAFDLIGRIDRVDEHPDGTLEIVDYKSGRLEVTEEDVAGDIAMACYQLLMSRNFPGRPVIASILSLRTGVKATSSLSAEDLAEFEKDLVILGAEILGVDWTEQRPSLKPGCIGCDFVPLCRQDEDYREAYDEDMRRIAEAGNSSA